MIGVSARPNIMIPRIAKTPLRCLDLRIAMLSSVAILTSIHFLVFKHVQYDARSRWSGQRSSLSSMAVGEVSNNIAPLSCRDTLADANIYDPNKGIPNDVTRRLTITEPQFYISLHNQSFDLIRWVHIMEQGEYYERGLTSLFHRLLSSNDTNTTRPPPLVLDIGMNVGWFSLYSRAHGHEVASFEPNPTMFLRMCESLEYNNWREDDGWISLWNYGLGSTPGVFNLTLGKNPGASSFHEENLAPEHRRTMPVRVATLDSIAMMRGWLDRRIPLAKVDVEGFEDQVIEGGKRLILNGNVENIIMENGNKNITTLGLMLDTLYDAGYRLKEILTVNGDPYHEDWWHTFNPALEERRKAGEAAAVSDQLAFLAKVTCNIWWQHKRIASDDV